MNRRMVRAVVVIVGGLAPAIGYASQADTSAWATGGRGGRSGTAGATAHYDGDLGLARTYSRSGDINYGRGVALGVDEDGMSLSVSHAVAGRNGAGVGGTFNLSVDRDGQTSTGYGRVVADGGYKQHVQVAGSTRAGGPAPSSTVTASGRTWGGGQVRADTYSTSSRRYQAPRRVLQGWQIARPVR